MPKPLFLLESPAFACPHCGSRQWTKTQNGWECSPNTGTEELTDLRLWVDYIYREYSSIEAKLKDATERKELKTSDGKPALIETVEVTRYKARLTERENLCEIATILEILSSLSSPGQVFLTDLRLQWNSPG